MNVAIIIGTTRQDRVTPRLAQWIMKRATEKYPETTFTMLDLRDYEMPLLEEAPWMPNRTLTDGAQRWLADLDAADGYIFATAEYNHNVPAVLKNALDYTNGQLNRKPALVYSQGANQGARANELLRTVLNSLIGAISIPGSGTFFGNVAELLDESGNPLDENTTNEDALVGALAEFDWYLTALHAAKEV